MSVSSAVSADALRASCKIFSIPSIDQDVSFDTLYARSQETVAKGLGLEPSDVYTRIFAMDCYEF